MFRDRYSPNEPINCGSFSTALKTWLASASEGIVSFFLFSRIFRASSALTDITVLMVESIFPFVDWIFFDTAVVSLTFAESITTGGISRIVAAMFLAGILNTLFARLFTRSTARLSFTVAAERMSIRPNNGADRPYLMSLMRAERFFCSIKIRCLSRLWLKKLLTSWFCGALNVWL